MKKKNIFNIQYLFTTHGGEKQKDGRNDAIYGDMLQRAN